MGSARCYLHRAGVCHPHAGQGWGAKTLFMVKNEMVSPTRVGVRHDDRDGCRNPAVGIRAISDIRNIQNPGKYGDHFPGAGNMIEAGNCPPATGLVRFQIRPSPAVAKGPISNRTPGWVAFQTRPPRYESEFGSLSNLDPLPPK